MENSDFLSLLSEQEQVAKIHSSGSGYSSLHSLDSGDHIRNISSSSMGSIILVRWNSSSRSYIRILPSSHRLHPIISNSSEHLISIVVQNSFCERMPPGSSPMNHSGNISNEMHSTMVWDECLISMLRICICRSKESVHRCM